MRDQIETEIKDLRLTAPRVTPSDIEDEIVAVNYFTAADGERGQRNAQYVDEEVSPASLELLTFCVLTLRNGFTVTGESACASPENYNRDLGRKIARANAANKIWPLLGFRLRDKLSIEA